MLTKLINWFTTPYTLFLLFSDPNISWKTRLKASILLLGAAFYVLNPVDLIPEFTPVIGWLDDLVVVLAAIIPAQKILPEVSFEEISQKARSSTKRVILWTVAFIITAVILSLSVLGLLIYLVVKA